MVTALELPFEITGSIPAAALSSATLAKSFTHTHTHTHTKQYNVVLFGTDVSWGVNKHTVRRTGPVAMVAYAIYL